MCTFMKTFGECSGYKQMYRILDVEDAHVQKPRLRRLRVGCALAGYSWSALHGWKDVGEADTVTMGIFARGGRHKF